MDLIEMALTQAAEIEIQRKKSLYAATLAAVSGLFSKAGPREFQDWIQRAEQEIRAAQLVARGHSRSAVKSAAAQFLAELGKIGLRPPKKKGKK